MPKFNHIATFVAVRTAYLMFELLPLRAASALGGWLGRTVGPFLPVSNIARKNLKRILPERAAEHERIIRGMWDNFGRVFAEYPHLKTIAESKGGARIELLGEENLHAFRDMGRGGIMVLGHLANWESGAHFLANRGMPTHVVFRPPNNRLVSRLLESAREGAVSSIEKGSSGARQIITALKQKEFVGLLVDQKMNDGISVPFMGVPAMTAAAPAQLAMRYQVPIVVIRCERVAPLHFRWTVLPPFIPPADGDEVQIMTRINDQISEWVRARPEQWLWVHRRWGKDL